MKIGPDGKPIKIEGPGGGRKSPSQVEKPGDSAFSKILGEKMSEQSGKAGEVKLPPLGHVSPVTSSLFQMTGARKETVQKVERLLTTMGLYQNSLANTAVPLARMEEVLKAMVLESGEALRSTAALPEDDGLKDIVHDAALTVSHLNRQFYNS